MEILRCTSIYLTRKICIYKTLCLFSLIQLRLRSDIHCSIRYVYYRFSVLAVNIGTQPNLHSIITLDLL